jgi:hypothetical protein
VTDDSEILKHRPYGPPCWCGAACGYEWREEEHGEPCWGRVEISEVDYTEDGDTFETHACQGHANCSWGDPWVAPGTNDESPATR